MVGFEFTALVAAIDAAGGERADFLGQIVREVRALDLGWDFRLRQFRGVNH